MRAKEFINKQVVTELNMAPGNLAKFAATATNMMAGFEAEVILPGEYRDDDDQEQDLDRDEPINNNTTESDIRNFFDMPGRDILDRRLIKEFDKFVTERRDAYIDDNYSNEEQSLRDNDPDVEWDDDELQDAVMDTLLDDFEKFYIPELGEYLREQGVYSMATLADSYSGFGWPHWKTQSTFSVAAEPYAEDFAAKMQVNYEVGDDYDSVTRTNDTWIFEPDSSINPTSGHMGIEIISPPMPVTEMLTKMNQTFAWVKANGGITNKSCGFHVGVSIKGLTADKVDYVKLALFLGDNYVLEKFGRAAANYARSSYDMLRTKVSTNDPLSGRIFALKKGLVQSVSTMIAVKNERRHMSINVNDDYIEFRSMGGNYLDQIKDVNDTVLRYVRAFAVAADPQAHKQEYMKKLSQFLNPQNLANMNPFVYYAAGMLTKDQLISSVKREKELQRQKEADAKLAAGYANARAQQQAAEDDKLLAALNDTAPTQ